jgi:hypothetical protein
VTNIEKFELPQDWQVWCSLTVNAVFGTVLSEYLWLWYVISIHNTVRNLFVFLSCSTGPANYKYSYEFCYDKLGVVI